MAAPQPRVYELVTPSGDVGAGAVPVARPSSDGNAVAFQTFGTPEGGPGDKLNTYVATRTPTGWTSRLLTPDSLQQDANPPLYYLPRTLTYLFNDDLSRSVFTGRSTPPLVPGEPTNVFNLYMRDGDAVELITDRAPTPLASPYFRPAMPRAAWASSDLEHIVFDSAGETVVSGNDWAEYYPNVDRGVYRWSPGGDMELVSILPNGVPARDATAGTGPLNPLLPNGIYGMYWGGDKRAISEDGKRIIFSSHGSSVTSAVGNIYVRKDHGTPEAETVQISAPEPGAPPVGFGAARFWNASPDGHRVLFQTCNRLTTDSTALHLSHPCFNYREESPYTPEGHYGNKPELYLWDEDANGGAGDLVDITTQDPDGADVLGVIGTSDDLTRVYFVARGNLGGDAVDGAANVYLWEQGEGITYIGAITEVRTSEDLGDADTWRPSIGEGIKDGEVSPDGRFVAFTTSAPLDPTFTNTHPTSGRPTKQVYLWEIGDDAPTCVSCRGGSPPRDARLRSVITDPRDRTVPQPPTWDKRNLLPDGRLYFEAGKDLLNTDQNGRVDVYEYNPATDELALISSGNTSEPVQFLTATADGRSVFIRSQDSLVSWDTDGNADIYDARVEGQALPPPPGVKPPCTGIGCTPPPGALFDGPADPKPAPVGRLTVSRITKAQRRKLAKTGRLTLRVGVPRAGEATARLLVPRGRKTVASSTARASAPGTVRMTLRLSARARKALRKGRRMRLRAEVRFDRATRAIGLVVQTSRRTSR